MKGFQQAYSKAIGRVAKDQPIIPVSPAEDAARVQAKINWLESTVTQEIFSSISEEIEELEEKARELSCSYPQHQNHNQVINLLVRADTLRKVINKYASAK